MILLIIFICFTASVKKNVFFLNKYMLNIFHKRMLLVRCHPRICLQFIPCQNHDWQTENHWNWQATTVWKGGKRQLFFCRIGFVRRRSMSSTGADLSSFFVRLSTVLCMANRSEKILIFWEERKKCCLQSTYNPGFVSGHSLIIMQGCSWQAVWHRKWIILLSNRIVSAEVNQYLTTK